MALSVFPNLNEEQEISDSFKFVLYTPNADPLGPQSSFKGRIASQSTGDFPGENANVEGAPIASLNGVYEYSSNVFEFYMDVVLLQTIGETVTETVVDVELISYDGNSGYTATQFDATKILVSGVPSSVFTDQTFKFLMDDMKTVKVLPANTTESYSALIGWTPPVVKELDINHTVLLKLTYQEGSVQKSAVQAFSLPQKVRWRLDYGLNAFNTFLSKGKV